MFTKVRGNVKSPSSFLKNESHFLRLSSSLIDWFLSLLKKSDYVSCITIYFLSFHNPTLKNIDFFLRTPSLHTGINLFVCNMALSDTMMCLTAAPLTPITTFSGRWFLGRLPCVILPACQVVFYFQTIIGKWTSDLITYYVLTWSNSPSYSFLWKEKFPLIKKGHF